MERVLCSPAFGLGWQFWQRHRLGFCLLAGYLLALALVVRFAPTTPFWQAAIVISALPLGGGSIFLMGVFAYPEADIASAGSGYPPYLLTLPVRTRDLVLWPMLFGAVTVALCWIALAELVLRPRGIPVPAGWPAAMLAAMAASLQAIQWCPVGLPYLRVLLVLTVQPALLILGFAGAQSGISSPLLIGLFLGTILISYLLSLEGVARARRGDSAEMQWFPGRAERQRSVGQPESAQRAQPRTLPPFESAAQAQVWVEWRRNGIVLPLLVAGACGLFSLPLLWVQERAPLYPWAPGSEIASIQINVYLKTYLPVLLLLPAFIAGVIGCGVRKADTRKRDLTLHLFFATRPMADAGLVLAKLQAAAWSALSAWAVLLAFVGLWLLFPAQDGRTVAPLALLLLRHATLETPLLVLIALAGLVLWTWRNQVVGLFVDLTGRIWVVRGYPAVVFGLAWGAVMEILKGSIRSGDLDPRHLAIPPAVPWIVGLAVAAKVLATAGALYALRRQGLVGGRVLTRLVLGWILLALAGYGLFTVFLRDTGLAALPLPHGLLSAPSVAALVILFLPITRLALAPLALAWNRHR